ncbi:beta-glucosidase [Nocardia sp. SYP-A9097]|uniref:glycoside hydrolase family 3 N-terminal domain-containing protein n=1 Tax=Nocardia sp. SYP-A9097 TaxID=2663237 RepID=UPI00129A5B73|nr:glycoside hydrolase family 3 N-terminal domain-containing protein [Nocardia sp. SYP-A9097]MRH91709.1 beta-glucosidase [Nocardia sp. SYP-A9097]
MALHPLISQLTDTEKAALCTGASFWDLNGVPRLGVEGISVADGPHGLRRQAGAADHLGIADSLPATCFPTASGLASSFDPELLARIGAALAVEARAAGVSVLLGPGVNMKRSPLCGRNFEYFSEDPYLAGELGAAMVNGLQDNGIGASVKHFAANNQEDHRLTVSAEVDERALREIYLPAFETIVRKAQPWTVMCSYNRLNGIYTSEHRWLLTEVLRHEWGFEGLVVSDWLAVNDRAAGITAGLDLEMPTSPDGPARVLAALESGELDRADLDRAASRVLALIDRAHAAAGPTIVDPDAHHELAREAARRSAVLLRNDGALPLAETGAPIVVVGPFATTPRYQGAGSSRVVPTRVDNALDALRAALPDRRIDHFPDYDLVAAAAAAEAAEVLVFAGLPESVEAEGFDRAVIDLPAEQTEFLELVRRRLGRLTVVVQAGSAVALPFADHADAILFAWLGGQAGGAAIADLLSGAHSPAGKLAETLPVDLRHTPAHTAFPGDGHTVDYRESIFIGYRWYETRGLPVAFPFGHGLTYTTFGYSDLEVSVEGDTATAQFTIANTGEVAADEIAQVYVADPESELTRPVHELKGFARIHLAPGEARRLSIELDRRAFAYWHPAKGSWHVEAGEFIVQVGASSADIRLAQTIRLDGDTLRRALTPDSPTGAWLADPDYGSPLRAILAQAAHGMVGMLLDNPDLHPGRYRILQNIPLNRLGRTGLGCDLAAIDEIIRRGVR